MKTLSWDEFPTTEFSPAEGEFHSEEVRWFSGRQFQAVPDNGWEMLICWEAGPARVLRVRTSRVDLGGTCEAKLSATGSETDDAIIEFEINSYLADAGVPPRPSGYIWYLRVPRDSSFQALVALIFAREEKVGRLRPVDSAACMRHALVDYYSQ